MCVRVFEREWYDSGRERERERECVCVCTTAISKIVAIELTKNNSPVTDLLRESECERQKFPKRWQPSPPEKKKQSCM